MCFNFKWSKCLKPAGQKKGNSISQPGLCTWALPRKCPWISPQDVQLDISVKFSAAEQHNLTFAATPWPGPNPATKLLSQASAHIKNRQNPLAGDTLRWTTGTLRSSETCASENDPNRSHVNCILWSCVLNSGSKYRGYFGVLIWWVNEWRDLLLYGRQQSIVLVHLVNFRGKLICVSIVSFWQLRGRSWPECDSKMQGLKSEHLCGSQVKPGQRLANFQNATWANTTSCLDLMPALPPPLLHWASRVKGFQDAAQLLYSRTVLFHNVDRQRLPMPHSTMGFWHLLISNRYVEERIRKTSKTKAFWKLSLELQPFSKRKLVWCNLIN